MRLGFVIVYVSDVQETLQFYKRAFGLEIRLEHKDEGLILYGEMETEGAVLGFGSHEMGKMTLEGKYQKATLEKEPFGQEIVFVSEDVHGAFSKAVAAGAVSVAEPQEKPWGQTVAYLRDREGILIELCSPMDGS